MCEKLVKLVIVCVHRNAVVGGGIVEFLEEKLVLPVGIVEGGGKKQFQTIIKLLAITNAALISTVTSHLACHVHPLQILLPFRDDVNDPEESTGDIQGGIGSSDHFDAVD